MNKFHVNVPTVSQPRSVAGASRGKVLDKKPITPVTEKLSVTVNGVTPPRSAASPDVRPQFFVLHLKESEWRWNHRLDYLYFLLLNNLRLKPL